MSTSQIHKLTYNPLAAYNPLAVDWQLTCGFERWELWVLDLLCHPC